MRREKGLSFHRFFRERGEDINYIISDVDDTITKSGKLLPHALDALYKLKASGRTIILLTGGSAGWSDAYIRQWPVDAVICESGAVFLGYSKGGEITSIINPEIEQDKVLKLRRKLMEYTSAYPFSSDQFARVFDVAYDKKKMTEAEKTALRNILTLFGASFSESSIHINAWFGNYDKKSSLKYFLPNVLSISEKEYLEEGIYLGDSLNDEPLFGYFPLSVGMHSVEDMRSSFKELPTYISQYGGGDGFFEVAAFLCKETGKGRKKAIKKEC